MDRAGEVPVGVVEQSKAVFVEAPESGENRERIGVLRGYISSFNQIIRNDSLVNKEAMDRAIASFGGYHNFSTEDVIRSDGSLGRFFTERLNEYSEFANLKEFLGSVARRHNLADRKGEMNQTEYLISSREEEREYLGNLLSDLNFTATLNRFLNQMVAPQDRKDELVSVTLAEAKKAFEETELAAAHEIASLGSAAFKEDVLLVSPLPLVKRRLPVNQEEEKSQGSLETDLAQLAFLVADGAVVQRYQEALGPIWREEEKLIGELHGKDFSLWDHRHHLPVMGSGSSDRAYLSAKIKDLASDIARDEGVWEKLQVTDSQRRLLYDLAEKPLFERLYAGGYESWEGSTAAMFFARLGDPRAIPGLIEHLRRSGTGHTSRAVVDAIVDLVEKPLSKESLDKVVASCGPLDQRIINEWFLKPAAFVGGAASDQQFGYAMAGLVEKAEKHLALGDLAKLADRLAKQDGKPLEEKTLRSFFWGNFGEWFGTQKVETVLLGNISETLAAIASSKYAGWRLDVPKIFGSLVNLKDGNYFSFPEKIAREGLGLSSEYLGKLKSLYGSKELSTGAMARVMMAEGLLFLSGKDGGKTIAENLLSACSGAREDPKRMRQVFRYLETLDKFGAFSYVPGEKLADIVGELRGRVVKMATERLFLGEYDQKFLAERVDFLVESEMLEIIPALLSKFDGEKRTEVAKVVREIGQHVVRGDFEEWRNGLETSQRQLSILSKEARAAWLVPNEAVLEVRSKTVRDEEKGTIEAIKRITSEAKAHLGEVYKMDFSEERLRDLERTRRGLIESIKSTGNAEAKRDLGMRKRQVDAEMAVVEGFQRFDQLSGVDAKAVMDLAERMKSAMATLSGLEQPIRDLNQIERVFGAEEKVGTERKFRAYDSDDPVVLLKVGTEPRETCQSWRGGSHNYCLPAYVVDANKRAINVEDDKGQILARSMLKLTRMRATREGKDMPALVLEPVYTNFGEPELYRAVVRLAMEKAKDIGGVLLVGGKIMVQTGADNSQTVELLPQEANRAGFLLGSYPEGTVFIPQSYNSYEYSDTFGGDISMFDRFESMGAGMTVVVPPGVAV